tara:strand:+ start:1482 stop:1724 length:243 start_codon:yes stop_codon:yes gene_type:complete
MKLNANYIARALTGKTKKKNWNSAKNYTNTTFLHQRINNLEDDIFEARKSIRVLCKKLKLEKVGDVIMDEKDAKKYNDQY